MASFLAIALSFPAVVFTVLLSVSLVYWAFVIFGAARVNLLGDGAAEGALDGMDGHLDGAADGHLDAAADGHLDGAADGHLDGADAHDVGDGHGALAGMMASLKLRSAPATVVLSTILLFSWLFSMLGMQAAIAWLPAGAVTIARVAIFVLAPLLALFPTSLCVRPLARVFVPPKATAHEDLVGKVCTIRTGTVTDRFGEATLDDGAAGVVVRVRIDAGNDSLKRGDQAVIVGYDEERQEFSVAPMDLEIESVKSLKKRR